MLLVSSQTSLARMSHTQLMQILSDDSNSDAIAWMPHGLTFVIHNRDKLISEILPHYFGEKIKFTSFTRKLKRWSFVRVPTGDGDAAFYNKVRKYYVCARVFLVVVECLLNNSIRLVEFPSCESIHSGNEARAGGDPHQASVGCHVVLWIPPHEYITP